MPFCLDNVNKQPIIKTLIPGQEPIELVSYYEEFLNYYPECEMATKQWFVENIGRDWIIFDCGANIGYFSILFARLANEGQIYAFEPTSTYNMLLQNLNYHQIKNVIPLQLALGKKSGKLEEAVFRIWGNEPERQIYNFTTIDNFVQTQKIDRLDCIKIDVDSFDFEVLQGAEETLINYNPFVMVELNYALSKRGQSNIEALEWLTSLGYHESLVFDYDNFLLRRDFKLIESTAVPMAQFKILINCK